MSFIQDFKAFALKGNVMDMAVGVIIGGAFGAIVNSLVNDVIMPVISLATGKVDFSNLFVSLDGTKYATLAEAQEAGGSVFAYGSFIQAVIEFLIIALCIFLVVKGVNKLRKPEPEAAPTTKVCPFCKNEVPLEATRCGFCTSELK